MINYKPDILENEGIYVKVPNMNEPYAELYNEMLGAIDDCLRLNLSERNRFDKCFYLAKNYSKQLKGLKRIDFNNKQEEIDFFKKIKPAFTWFIEYFAIIVSALHFVPDKHEEAIVYWQYEKNRFQRFCDRYKLFIEYYESDKNVLDNQYFLRENNDLRLSNSIHIYDSDIDWCTSHDRLVRNYFAYKMYKNFCDEKLSVLYAI